VPRTTEAEHVRAWQPALPGVREVFHARFVEHRYPPHTHDTWTVLIVDQGAIRYDLDNREHGSSSGTVTVLPPHVVHNGRAAHHAGFRKRVLYLEPAGLSERLVGPAVDHPRIDDPRLHRALDLLHRRLQARDDFLGGEATLAAVVEQLHTHLGWPSPAEPPKDPRLADQLRQLLDARVFETVTLSAAGSILEASPTHLVRSFTGAYGISPHAYVISRRIDSARRRLLDGQPAATVAIETGFHDQAHLSRHFTHHVGTTPGRFANRPAPTLRTSSSEPQGRSGERGKTADPSWR
jgi:AraC-like DNA-binding protein